MLAPACQQVLLDTLACALRAENGRRDTCSERQATVFNACATQIAALQKCGVSLPGAEECRNVGNAEGPDYCERSERCNSVTFTTRCATKSFAELNGCTCLVDGQESFRISSNERACVLYERIACGPVLLF